MADGCPTTSTTTSAPCPSVSLTHRLGRALSRSDLVDVDYGVGAESGGQFEPFGHPVDRDDPGGAAGLGHGHRVQAQCSRALHDDVLTELLVDAFEPVHHLRQCAVGAGSDVVGDGVGHGVDHRTGR